MTEKNEMTVTEERARRIGEIVQRYGTPVPEGADADEYYMRAALELASAAADYGDVPVGCVIVRDGEIIAAECNGREVFHDALYHAETAAISAACRKLGGWRLPRCTLYVTLEPCPMCAGAIWCARVPRVVCGVKDAKAGAAGSVINLNAYPLNHKFEMKFGVLERECRGVLGEFFRKRRKK